MSIGNRFHCRSINCDSDENSLLMSNFQKIHADENDKLADYSRAVKHNFKIMLIII